MDGGMPAFAVRRLGGRIPLGGVNPPKGLLAFWVHAEPERGMKC